LIRRFLWLAVVIAAAGILPGCAGLSILSMLASGTEKKSAQFTLPDKRTAILVDDPLNYLGDPSLKSVIASNVAFNLEENEALTVPPVSTRELAAVRAEMDEAYDDAPIDRIGRAVDAEQVIHVQINNITREYAPGVFRPSASYEVKVLDVVNLKRLFPEEPQMRMTEESPPGLALRSSMRFSSPQGTGVAELQALDRRLAERIGRDVARLFHDWKATAYGTSDDGA